MTLDQLIAKLVEMRDANGGSINVYAETPKLANQTATKQVSVRYLDGRVFIYF